MAGKCHANRPDRQLLEPFSTWIQYDLKFIIAATTKTKFSNSLCRFRRSERAYSSLLLQQCTAKKNFAPPSISSKCHTSENNTHSLCRKIIRLHKCGKRSKSHSKHYERNNIKSNKQPTTRVCGNSAKVWRFEHIANDMGNERSPKRARVDVQGCGVHTKQKSICHLKAQIGGT